MATAPPSSPAPSAPPPSPVRVGLRRRVWVGVVAAVVAAAIGGGAVGALTMSATSNRVPSVVAEPEALSPSPGEVHAQDVRLCTKFLLVNVATPDDASKSEVLPAVATLELALDQNQAASPTIRSAIAAARDAFAGRIAANVRARGLAELAPFDREAAQAAIDEAWAACRLDEE